jgi:hypothetical protein
MSDLDIQARIYDELLREAHVGNQVDRVVDTQAAIAFASCTKSK